MREISNRNTLKVGCNFLNGTCNLKVTFTRIKLLELLDFLIIRLRLVQRKEYEYDKRKIHKNC